MTERMRIEANWGYRGFVLKSGVLGEKGKLACLDTTESGKVVAGKHSATLFPIGTFDETKTGDGVALIRVKLFKEIVANWWTNDTVAAVTVAMVATECFIKDDVTVTSDGTGASVAGIVLGVDAAKGVLVFQDPALIFSLALTA